MSTYNATVTREGKWWMIHIPELDGLTQARRLGEAELMAREWIAAASDESLENVSVKLTVAKIGNINVATTLEKIQAERERAAELEKDAQRRASELAKQLAAADIPVRDIGAAMGVSFQRAHQLIHA